LRNDASWKVDSDGVCHRSDGKPCFMVITDWRAKKQQQIVSRILSSVFDVQLGLDSRRLNLRSVALPFACQMDANTKTGNPDLQKRLEDANKDVELLGLGSLGLGWIREHKQLEYVADNFEKLVWLDLSLNSLGGEHFEDWLFKLLARRPNLKAIVYGTIWVVCSADWKARCPANLRDRVIVTYHSFAKLKAPKWCGGL
jgi:hypothetical protein